jgi:hypothetical protein
MVSGYTPMVPTLGSLTMGGAALMVVLVLIGYQIRRMRQP